MANACLAFLSSGKSPVSALQSAGFQKNRMVTSKKIISYKKGDSLVSYRQPIWIVFTARSSKRGPVCMVNFNLKMTGYGWDMAGLAIGDAFLTAFAAEGYKKTVLKKKKGFLFSGREETYFVKSNSVYQFGSEPIPRLRLDHFNSN